MDTCCSAKILDRLEAISSTRGTNINWGAKMLWIQNIPNIARCGSWKVWIMKFWKKTKFGIKFIVFEVAEITVWIPSYSTLLVCVYVYNMGLLYRVYMCYCVYVCCYVYVCCTYAYMHGNICIYACYVCACVVYTRWVNK